jgi:hypothetical protein
MRCTFYSAVISGVILTSAFAQISPADALTFTFDDIPAHTTLPVDETVGTLTAHLSFFNYGSANGFSIQAANTLGFTPTGFSGNMIYPDSIYQSDLIVSFSAPVTDFSILYAPEEYGSDASAIMKVTASLNGVDVGSNTAQANPPGTWPVGTLSFNSAIFDKVVVHWQSAPSGAENWGPIFVADNMNVTLAPSAVPVPAALPLFATGLGGLGLLGWRKKRKAKLAA